MTFRPSPSASAATSRLLRVGVAACLLASAGGCAAVPRLSAPIESHSDAAAPASATARAAASDAASTGATTAPAWLPGLSPAAGETGDRRGDDIDDLADQEIWTPPGDGEGGGAAPKAPRPRRVPTAAPPADGAGPVVAARPPRLSPAEEATHALPATPADAADFVRRGDQLLEVGDVIGARLCYERAAASGMATAATRVGKTYDPRFLAASGVHGLQGDATKAAAWYRKGMRAGDPEALQLLSALARMPPR